MTLPFPEDWNHALVVVAHPDDPEYGMAAAVAKWTREGKRVTYVLASSGEAGIEGMDPEEAGPVREEEQRRSGAQVGVRELVWLDLPDGDLADSPTLDEALRQVLDAYPAEVVVTTYGGPEFEPGLPNQPDHIAVNEALAEILAGKSVWLFENGPAPTHHVLVEDEDVQAGAGGAPGLPLGARPGHPGQDSGPCAGVPQRRPLARGQPRALPPDEPVLRTPSVARRGGGAGPTPRGAPRRLPPSASRPTDEQLVTGL